jgi:mannose-6-phosphate isomerase
MYPLKFEPIFKTIVWGGEKIAPYKGVETEQEHIGESWELSGVKGNESVVANGALKGRTIADLVKEYKGRLVGEHVYANTGDEFPLLIKFIDALSDLSVQVHPNDELAAVRHNGSKGKTEMWYVVDAEPGAHLLAGMTEEITPEEYEQRVADGTITEVLARHDVHPGDVFFLPAGRIHAICGGCFIAEIQQTSDITYRIFDYNRPGLDGKPRQLHTQEAKDVIDYKVYPSYKTEYERRENEEMEVVSCPYFTTSVFELSEAVEKDLSGLQAVPGNFYIVMGLEGSGSVTGSDGTVVQINAGEALLVMGEDRLTLAPSCGKVKLLTTHL